MPIKEYSNVTLIYFMKQYRYAKYYKRFGNIA